MARDNALKFTFSYVPNAWTSVTLGAGTVHTAVTPAVAPPNGTVVTFAAVSPATGIATGTTYYVVNSSGVSFGLSQAPGGAAFTVGTGASALAMATVNLSPVVTTLGGRSAAIKVPASPSGHWSVAYSDALNVTRFRNTIADISVLVSQTVQSAIVNDAPLQSSTSEGNYYLRASIGVAGIVGPTPTQLVVQGNGVNSPTAPAQGDFDWLTVSNTGNVPANAQPAVISTTGTGGNFTVRAGVVTAGQTFVPIATAGGLTAGVQYLIGPGNVIYLSNGIALTATAADVSGWVGTFTPFSTFAIATAANNTSSILFDILPPAGCSIVFTSITGGTGLTTNTVYYVVASPTYGQVGLSATFNGTPITVTSALTAGAGFWSCLDKQPYLYVSNTVTANVLTAVASVGGSQAAPHGLELGDVIYLYQGSAAGTPTPVTDQAFYVNSVPSATTFTVSATINGVTATISGATSAVFAATRSTRILNVQVDKTIRPWMRAALFTQNGNFTQSGYVTIFFADLVTGRDNSLVN